MGKILEKPLSKRTYLNSDNHMKSLFKTLVDRNTTVISLQP